MTTTSNFDLTQTLYLFSFMSNTSAQQSGSAQELADHVYNSLFGTDSQHPNPFGQNPPGLIPTFGNDLKGGDWQLTWGPGVFQIVPFLAKADNTAYVVYSPSLDTYVVAVAGTDPKSLSDWWEEDFKVGADDNVDWYSFSPNGDKPTGIAADATTAQVSLGTATGIWALGSQLTQSTWTPTPNQHLADYLADLAPATSSTQLIVTGHSLGGALSPTLARWVKENNTQLTNVAAMPTAGPTPGNTIYQNGWDEQFSPVTVEDINQGNIIASLNNNIWNTADVVPHAWQNIFTPNQQDPDTPADQQFYFSNPVKGWLPIYIKLDSPMGCLSTISSFQSAISEMQNKGDAGLMERSGHITTFDQTWPLQHLSNGEVELLNAPPSKTKILDTSELLGFINNLALVHVWGYGTTAFGLDISIFQKLEPAS